MRCTIFALTGMLLFNIEVAFCDTHTASVDEYINVFQTGADATKIQASKELGWEGVTDTRLYDLIENQLNELVMVADANSANRNMIELIAHLIHALAYSGNTKYRPTLEGILDKVLNTKVRRHANEALDEIDKYAVWNPIIQATGSSNPEKSVRVNRVVNMLRSDDFELKRLGAKRVYFVRKYDQYELDTLAEELLSNMSSDRRDRIYVDSMKWMIKALASSGNNAYADTLNRVEEEAVNSGIGRYSKSMASKYLH